MSEAQVKATPSKAVNDLVDSLFEDLPEDDVKEEYWKSICADLIQSHQPLRDLLEKAQTLNVYIEARWGDSDATIQGLNRPLAAALEPWKPK